VVQVGGNGVTPGVIAAATRALLDHELIKVKVDDEREGREAALAALVAGTGAEVAQVLGKTALLFKKRKKKSKFADLDGPVGPVGSGADEAKSSDDDGEPGPLP
jgi:RNA-binding protein